MNLSNEQRELLSAYLDGEVTAAERALAQALLQRPEAASYVESLKRLRELASRHGQARAPQNFAALVRQAIEGDFDGISRPTSNQGDFDGLSRPTSNHLQLNAMPQASWRMPLFAAAAAVVMALGLFAVNALWRPEQASLETAARPQSPSSEVASGGTLRDKPAESDSIVLKENQPGGPESLKKSPSAQTGAEGKEAKRARKSTEDAQDHYEEKQNEDFGRNDAHRKDDDKNAAPENSRDGRAPNKDQPNDAQDSSRPQEDPASSKGGGVGGGGGTATGGARGSAAGKGDVKAAKEIEEEGVRRAREGGKSAPSAKPPTPPPADAKPPAGEPQPERSKAAEEAIVVTVSGGRDASSPSLATDALAVAAAYGNAKASDDSNGTTLEVEVDAEQLEEMIAALRKVAQGVPEQGDGSYHESGQSPAKARDYLPSRLRGAVHDRGDTKPMNDEAEKADAFPKPEMARPAAKRVRVKVQLR